MPSLALTRGAGPPPLLARLPRSPVVAPGMVGGQRTTSAPRARLVIVRVLRESPCVPRATLGKYVDKST
eukprot:2190847-Pleurochrysis_carterae.AAC.8